jgi:hypothetical protein
MTSLCVLHRRNEILHQADAFDLVPYSLLLHKRGDFNLPGGYVNWFRSPLSNRKSQIRVPGIFSSPFKVLSSVPQGSVMGPLLFNVFVNDLCEAVAHFRCLFFADDITIYWVIKFRDNRNLLQPHINSMQGWCAANSKLGISKTQVISFSRKPTYWSMIIILPILHNPDRLY